jgi:hypothetical protein
MEAAVLASHRLHGIVLQTRGLFITTAANNSNPSIQSVQVASPVLNGRPEVILQSLPVLLGARGSEVLKQLYYKPECRGFQTR